MNDFYAEMVVMLRFRMYIHNPSFIYARPHVRNKEWLHRGFQLERDWSTSRPKFYIKSSVQIEPPAYVQRMLHDLDCDWRWHIPVSSYIRTMLSVNSNNLRLSMDNIKIIQSHLKIPLSHISDSLRAYLARREINGVGAISMEEQDAFSMLAIEDSVIRDIPLICL